MLRNLYLQAIGVMKFFDDKDRKKFKVYAGAQLALSILDLLGVTMIGALSALTIIELQSKSPGQRVTNVLEWTNLEALPFRFQVGLLATLACCAMITRSMISIYLNKRIVFYIADTSALISGRLAHELFKRPLNEVREESIQERLFALTSGVTSLCLGVIAPSLQLIGDLGLLLILLFALLVVDSSMTIFAIIIFSLLGYAGFSYMKNQISTAAELNTQIAISSNEKLVELLMMYREYSLRASLSKEVNEFQRERCALAKTSGTLNFYPSVPKYFLETSIFITALVLGAFQFIRLDASSAVSTLTIFLGASTRIAPASLRIQQGFIGIRNSFRMAIPTMSLLEKLEMRKDEFIDSDIYDLQVSSTETIDFSLDVRKLNFVFPIDSHFKLTDINFSVPSGTSLAIVGPSGAGKSTLVDVILGFYKGYSGEVTVGGVPSNVVSQVFPGSLGYVPQEVPIINGTIAENVALAANWQEELLESVLEIAQLKTFVDSLPAGPLTEIGDRGVRLSGGQKQRLGLARALYTKPSLLVLDEATSALDSVMEDRLSESLKTLKGKVTTVIIAHRLSTIISADQLLYLEEGCTKAIGSFEEVRRLVPHFDVQANLSGY